MMQQPMMMQPGMMQPGMMMQQPGMMMQPGINQQNLAAIQEILGGKSSKGDRDRDRRRGGHEEDDGKDTGTVISWYMEKGFGFIKQDKGGDDIFAHVTGLKDGDALRAGDHVKYNIKFDDKVQKYRAEEVSGAWWERDLRKKYGRKSRSRSRGSRSRRRRKSRSRSRRRKSRSRRKSKSRSKSRRSKSRSRRRSRSKSICRLFQRSGKCEYGDKCKFEHVGQNNNNKDKDREEAEKVREKLREKSRGGRSPSKKKSPPKSPPKGKFVFDDY